MTVSTEAHTAGPAATNTPGLEARYEAERGQDRRQRQARVLVVAAVAMMSTMVLDFFNSRDLGWTALPWRCASAGLCLVCAPALLRVTALWLQTVLSGVPIITIMVLTEVLGQLSDARVADRYMMAAAMALASFLAIPPHRRASAIAIAVAGCLIYPLVPLALPLATPLPANIDLPLFTVGVVGLGLLAARRNEASRMAMFVSEIRDESLTSEMKALNAELLRLSTTDPLTGLANRRRLEIEIAGLWQDRRVKSLGMALIDVDHFKSVNDAGGHAAGDTCLQSIAKAVASVIREDVDCAARYGGEEFVVVVPNASEQEVRMLGYRLCRAVEDLDMPHPGRPGHHITISVGLAWRGSTREEAGADFMMREADQSLYHAKAGGRNQVAFLESSLV
jgi:diguanylate cyclase (GGDEF)-like protein